MRVQTSPDVLVARLAARQHGVVGVEQLMAAGLDDAAVWRRVQAERLHRVHRGVYAVGHARLTREGRWLAAVLACGAGAVLSHISVAALWGLRPTAAARIDVTVPRERRPRSTRAIAVHRPRRPPDVTVHQGIPVTTPTQTLIDLASVLPRPAMQQALEAAERLRLLNLADLPPKLQRLAGDVDTSVRSSLETRFLALCRDHGLPKPLVNTVVEGYEVDFCWPAERLIVEADSHEYHGTRAAFERDRERDTALTAAGWRVMRVTHRRLEKPREVAALLARVVGRP